MRGSSSFLPIDFRRGEDAARDLAVVYRRRPRRTPDRVADLVRQHRQAAGVQGQHPQAVFGNLGAAVPERAAVELPRFVVRPRRHVDQVEDAGQGRLAPHQLPPPRVESDHEQAEPRFLLGRGDFVHGALQPVGELVRSRQAVDVVENQEQRPLVRLQAVEQPPDRRREAALDGRQLALRQIQLERDAEEADLSDPVAEERLQLPMPRLVDALVQEALVRAAQRVAQVVHAPQEDVASDRIVLPLGQMAHEPGQRALADAPLAADEADAQPPLRAAADHAAQPLDLGASPDEISDRRRLSGSERTRFGRHRGAASSMASSRRFSSPAGG